MTNEPGGADPARTPRDAGPGNSEHTSPEPVAAPEPTAAPDPTDTPEPQPVPPAGSTPPPGAPRGDDPRLAGGGYPPPNIPPPGYRQPGDGPRFGSPPPGGWSFAPGTDGFATRYGLARPAEGRVFAGVCAAVARATNTDPVLWRVLAAVFSLAGGLGIVLYLVGWLLIPAEGDSGSPLEALIGRGRTSTNPLVIVAVAAGAAIGLSVVISQHRFWSVLLVVGLAVTLVVFGTRNGNLPGARHSGPLPAPPPPPPGPQMYAAPTRPGPVPPTYRPPFAPRGPYYPTPNQPMPPPGPYSNPGLTQQAPTLVPPPRPPKPPKQRSRLGLLTVSVALLATGVLGLLDLVGWSVPFPAYLAVPLAVVGLGMVVGTWLGRARGLIGLGLVLAAVLGIATVTGRVNDGVHGGAGDVMWTPATYTEVADTYEHGFGDATLDLSAVDFTDHSRVIDVRVNAGNTTVILPENVDVEVHARIDAGQANVFGQRWDGVNTGERTVSNLGADGAGGGHVVLNIRLNAGELEVRR